MRIVIVEDDRIQADILSEELHQNIASVEIETITTESEFRSRMGEFLKESPDFFVIDMMLRWTRPRLRMDLPAPDINERDPSRAGLRCQQMLASQVSTKAIPVILYSHLSRDNYLSDAGSFPPNVMCLDKGSDVTVSTLIKSFSQANAIDVNIIPSVFVVHGHDDGAKESVARLIERLGLRAVVLHEQASLGRTVIEKFEAHSDVAYAVILLTPDDVAKPKAGRAKLRPRARQNVIFELGYFAARLGRRKLCALYKPDVEIPSDLNGVLYIVMDAAGAWRSELVREMKAAGLRIATSDIF